MARRGRRGKDDAEQPQEPQDEQPQEGGQDPDADDGQILGKAVPQDDEPEEAPYGGEVPRAPGAQPELPLGQQPISWGDLSRIFTELEEASSEVDDLKEQLKQAKGRQGELANELAAAGRRVRFAALEHAAEDTKRDLARIAELQRQDLENAARAEREQEAQARRIRTRALRNRVVPAEGTDPAAGAEEPPPPPAAEEPRTEETDAA